ncbi:hypothetical protein IH922_06390, partial [candidate division KSB1 bacterium]|nr:hypothetical protein [candidate division KSB1 bacterium]
MKWCFTEALRIHAPEMLYDLPTNAKRLVQRTDGYRMTLVSGEVILEDGEPTGALPGKLIRGAQSAPGAAIESRSTRHRACIARRAKTPGSPSAS